MESPIIHKTLRFSLPVTAPFRLDLTIWALKRRRVNGLEQWDGKRYTRIFIVDDLPVKIELEQKESQSLSVSATHVEIPHLKSKLSHLLNETFGLNKNLEGFYTFIKKDKYLSPLVSKFLGVKPPRFPTLFEAFANAIACQQLSLGAAFSLLNKFTRCFGKTFKEGSHIYYAFPRPEQIMKCLPSTIMQLGFSRTKSEALILLANELVHNEKAFQSMMSASNEDLVPFFCQLKGIGRWSAEYVLLRGLGRTDILPGDDVAVHKGIQKLLNLRQKPTYEKIKKIEKQWYPYAGLVYFHLLLQKLSENQEL